MSSEPQGNDHIAIIGMAGRFPAARSVARFWQMLAEGRTATRWLTDAELLAEGVSPADMADPDYVRAANILPEMECFDAGFFGFSPKEASILDPQHRHFLECAWEAFEDAGHVPEKFDGRVGVFAGSGMQAYLSFNLLSNPELVAQVGLFLLRHTGNDKDFMPTRLSYLLDLKGPSVAVQTACSTSLVAVHLASASLLSGECDMAIAGGVTIELPHRQGYRFTEGEILSPDGLCRAFDEESKGTVFGSGAAVVMLRRLEDALADGDDVKAILIGSAVNNDGSQKAGYLAPSVDGQAEAAAEALAIAGVDPASVSYVEAHGTGTPVGDPIELTALTQAYRKAPRGSIGIGSVKTNIGHLDTAAGAASLIKVVEALRHETIPATLNYRTPNSRFDLPSSPFFVADKARPWKRGTTPRRAAVNSLGVGGTNAHVIVQEAPERAAVAAPESWRIFPFSARNQDALDGLAAKWTEFAAGAPGKVDAADAAFTLQNGRRRFETRRAVVGRHLTDISAPDKRRVVQGAAGVEKPGLVFLFPGGGAQFPGVGAGLLRTEPVFARTVDECFNSMPADVPADLRSVMFERGADDAEAAALLEQPIYALPALFILEVAFAKMWQHWGVQPDCLIGHSAGEYAAACISGILSIADGLRIVALRGRLMQELPAGAMTAIPAGEEKARELAGSDLDIAAINSPDLCVLSGPVGTITALEKKLAGTDSEARRLRINVAAHSRMLDGALEQFGRELQKIRYGKGAIPIISTLRGDWARDDDLISAAYWTRHLRETVRYGQAVSLALGPDRILIECGPGNALGKLAQMNGQATVLASTRQAREDDDDLAVALTSAASLWTRGVDLAWENLPGAGGRRVSLPTYAFEKKVHWIKPGSGHLKPADTAQVRDPLARREDVGDWFETFQWTGASLPPVDPLRGESWMVLGDDGPLTASVTAAFQARGTGVILVRKGDTFAATGDGVTVREDQAEDFEKLLAQGKVSRILWLWPVTSPVDFAPAFLLARALQTADIIDDVRLSFVTEGSVSVSGEELSNVDAALLTGVVRVSPREIPGLVAQVIDLDPAMDTDASARMILEEGDAASREDRVAFRQGRRLVPVLRACGKAGSGESRIRKGGHYLIAGGTGGIGRELARYLCNQYQAKVTLLGRSGLPPQSQWEVLRRDMPQSKSAQLLALIEEVTLSGGLVQVVAADVTDRQGLAAVLDKVALDCGKIDGVFHAAGAVNDAPMAAKSLDDVAEVMQPKVTGGQNLSDLLPVGSIDFFAVFSSSSVTVAPPGQVDYIAANAWLEALAASRSDGLSIAWGVWADTGMAAETYGTAGQKPGPHPLLGPLETQHDGIVQFQCYYDPSTAWVLLDHVVGGTKLLPGTAYLEIARAAVQAIEPNLEFEINNLSLALPMAFAGNAPRLVRVELAPSADGYEFRIESASGPDLPMAEHCRARILRRKRADRTIPAGLRISGPVTRSERSGHALQAGLIEFGPRWNCIGEIRLGAEGAEADFTLPDEFVSDLDVFKAHPGMTDMALTIGLHLLPELRGTPTGIFAPVSFDRVRILAGLTRQMSAQAVVRTHERNRLVIFDVVLRDSNQQPLMVIEGLSMRYVEGAKLTLSNDQGPSVTSRMLMSGIRASEADEVFARVLANPARNMIVSPVSPASLRMAFAQAVARPIRKRAPDEARSGEQPFYANEVEARIAFFWEELLGGTEIGPDDDFFDIGGHSLSAVRLFAKIRKEYDVDLPLAALFQASKLRDLASLVIAEGGIELAGQQPAVAEAPRSRTWSPLVQIKAGSGDGPPIFCVHGAGGNVLNFRSLAGYLPKTQAFYGLQARGVDGVLPPNETIEAMAEQYLQAIREVQPEGPYFLAGYSGGGVVAYEMARQLVGLGESVGHVIMFDSLAPHVTQTKMTRLQKLWAVRHWSIAFAMDWPRRHRKAKEDKLRSAEIRRILASGQPIPAEYLGRRMTDAYHQAQMRYKAMPYDGEITMFAAARAGTEFLRAGRYLGWDSVVQTPIRLHRFDCDHFNMMADPTIAQIAELLTDIIRAHR